MRKAMLIAIVAATAIAGAILPSMAGSETGPAVTAVNGTGIYAEQVHSWSPPHLAVAEGSSVTFSNPTAVPHGVRWVSSPATPVCGAGVPVGTSEAASGKEWSGSCTFAQAGTYVFYCTVHGAAMSGTITVGAPPSGPPISSPLPGAPGEGAAPSGAGTATGLPGGAGSPSPVAATGSPFAGGAARALKLAAHQRGSSVHGSVEIASAGAHGRLEVDVLAGAGALGGAGHGGRVRVGSLLRSSLIAGTVRFAVPLSGRAQQALIRRGHLALTVKLVLRAPGGAANTLVRSVTLRALAR
jgi:plastocyanin